MSILSVVLLVLVSAVIFGRAAATWRDDEPHASLAQVISGAMYLTLLLVGSFEAAMLFSAVTALQFYYFPTPYQRQRHEYYPEDMLPYVNFSVAAIEVAVWLIFQQIR